MKKVRDLTRDQLEFVVSRVLYRLWVNQEDVFDLEQEVDGADLVDDMAKVLREVGLAPDDEQDGENAIEHLRLTREAKL